MVNPHKAGLGYPKTNFQQAQLGAVIAAVQPFSCPHVMNIFEAMPLKKRQKVARSTARARADARMASALYERVSKKKGGMR